jgi:hypothetical protein
MACRGPVWVKSVGLVPIATFPLPSSTADIGGRRWRFSCVPQSGCEQSQQIASLFDHLVGRDEQPGRDGQAESIGGLEVDHQFKSARLHDRQVRDLCTLKEAAGIETRLKSVLGAHVE